MKIALFIHTLSGGGVERSTIRLAKCFSALGHQVDILAFSGRGDMRSEAQDTARVFDFEAPWWIRRMRAYLSYIWKENPDLVIAATAGPNMIASLVNGLFSRKRPVIISQRGWDGIGYEPQKRLKPRILQKLVRASYRRADALVAVSSGVADQWSHVRVSNATAST